MENKAMCSDGLSDRAAHVEQDLLQALLQAEGVSYALDSDGNLAEDGIRVADQPQVRISYPWNPTSPDADPSFAGSEDIFAGFSDAEIEQQAGSFFAGLDSLFSETTVQTSLQERFGRVPQTLLQAIAQRAAQVATSTQSFADQLVQAAQDVLPSLSGWTLEDLGVQARPLAFALRSSQPKPVEISVREADWEVLSDVEKAKLSLIAAQYALDILNQTDSEAR